MYSFDSNNIYDSFIRICNNKRITIRVMDQEDLLAECMKEAGGLK